jgi:membrane dipeptidase
MANVESAMQMQQRCISNFDMPWRKAAIYSDPMSRGTVELERRQALGFLLGSAAASRTLAHAPIPVTPKNVKSRWSFVMDMLGGFGPDDIPALAASGLNAISMTLGQVGNAPGRFEALIGDIATVDGLIERYRTNILLARRFSDLARAKATDRTAIIYNVQDTSELEGDSSRIAVLKNLGIGVVQLTYNKRNLCGDGCLEPENAGLSDFGREVITAINDQHLLLDLSHGGQRTISEAARYSKAPAAVTHTACRALVNNQRNLYDEQMREIADRGGVVGIFFIAYLRSGIGQPALDARPEDLIAHIEHASNVVGEDHIGIGTDGGVGPVVITPEFREFWKKRYEDRVHQGVATAGEGPDAFNFIPQYNMPDRLLRLADDLARRGWPARRIDKLLGANFHRLLGEVWNE